MAFKAGDRVYVSNSGSFPGKQPATVLGHLGKTHLGSKALSVDYYHVKVDSYGTYTWYDDGDMELINDSPTASMSILEKIRLAAKGEPEKSFIKTGITNLDGSFTSDGKEAFLSYLLEVNKDGFNTSVVQPLLVEQEKEG